EKISNFIGETFQALGRPHHALKWCQFPLRAVRTPGRVEWMIGDCWTKLADDERALAAFHRSADLGQDMPDGQVGISHVLLLQGNFNGARTALQTLRFRSDIGESDKLVAEIEFFARDFAKAEQLYQQLAGSDRWGGGQFWGAVTYQSALARIRQEQGRQREAEELLEQCLARQKAILADEPLNPEAAYRVGAIEAMMGRPEAALHNLRRAIDLGWLDYRSPTLDPRFDSLRSLPEFAQIMNTISDTVRRMRAEAQQLTN
ncbi:MAG: tetratricopeptide repeat protein, partial [Chthoniobacterales bacterium]